MTEFDAFPTYPVTPRRANRTILNSIQASYRDREFYEGDRQNGYGGMKDDGRWGPVAENLIRTYNLTKDSQVLQINCHKGFLLKELLQRGIGVRGIEQSDYALREAPWQVEPFVRLVASYNKLLFAGGEFDLVLAVSPVYQASLPDAMRIVKEIQRVGRGRAFITLGAYETEAEYFLLKRWFLLASTVLTKAEWREVLTHCGYTGDYRFDTVQSLGLE